MAAALMLAEATAQRSTLRYSGRETSILPVVCGQSRPQEEGGAPSTGDSPQAARGGRWQRGSRALKRAEGALRKDWERARVAGRRHQG